MAGVPSKSVEYKEVPGEPGEQAQVNYWIDDMQRINSEFASISQGFKQDEQRDTLEMKSKKSIKGQQAGKILAQGQKTSSTKLTSQEFQNLIQNMRKPDKNMPSKANFSKTQVVGGVRNSDNELIK